MKNPFIMIALAVAAAQAQFSNIMASKAGYKPPRNSRGPTGPRQPAGTKFARQSARKTCTVRNPPVIS